MPSRLHRRTRTHPGVLTCGHFFLLCCMQGSFVTFEHNSNRVNIFYNPATNLVTRVPKRG